MSVGTIVNGQYVTISEDATPSRLTQLDAPTNTMYIQADHLQYLTQSVLNNDKALANRAATVEARATALETTQAFVKSGMLLQKVVTSSTLVNSTVPNNSTWTKVCTTSVTSFNSGDYISAFANLYATLAASHQGLTLMLTLQEFGDVDPGSPSYYTAYVPAGSQMFPAIRQYIAPTEGTITVSPSPTTIYVSLWAKLNSASPTSCTVSAAYVNAKHYAASANIP